MTLFRQLQRAKFKDIEFFWTSGDMAGGRKTVTHEYPNSDRRFVEDLGKNQKIFTIQGVISGPRYLRKRDALIEVLEKPGAGILVHPLYGSQNVVLKNYTISENETKLGEANISMSFEKADLNIFPIQTSNNTSFISKLTTGLISLSEGKFVDKYDLTTSIVQNYNAAKDKINSILDVFEAATTGVNVVADNINALSSEILDFRQRINSIITAPQELASAITGLFNSLDGIASVPAAQVDLLTTFYDFGDDDAEIFETTPQRIERKNNDDALNDIILVDSLTLTYDAVLSLPFGNTDEISTLKNILNDQTISVINRESLDPELRDDIIEQKLEIDKYLVQQEVVTPKVVETDTPVQPLMVLGYRFYGNTDNFETLITLNNNPDINFMEGTVKVLTI